MIFRENNTYSIKEVKEHYSKTIGLKYLLTVYKRETNEMKYFSQ